VQSLARHRSSGGAARFIQLGLEETPMLPEPSSRNDAQLGVVPNGICREMQHLGRGIKIGLRAPGSNIRACPLCAEPGSSSATDACIGR
jgi:hypothetical protein